jgi:DeoR/GlpR family transcriptional regulator of sugar metabolism
MIKENWSFKEERLELILQEIRNNASVLVSDLAREFQVSESTIRLDLKKLDAAGKITRTHGGAIVKEDIIGGNLLAYETIKNRMTHLQSEKEAIGKKAASLIRDGDTLLIDGGSTTAYVMRDLMDRTNLTVITNSVIILQEVFGNPNINLFALGGLAIGKHGVTVGSVTIQSLSHFYPNKTILGIDGLSAERGLMAADADVPAIAGAKSEMVKAGGQLIVVCDHTKLNKICPMPVAPIEKLNILVTDAGAPADVLKAISEKGPKVLIAE